MKPILLQDELIKDFQEQKLAIADQMALLDPLARSLRKPAAKRLLSAGMLIFAEIICWMFFLAAIALFVFFNKLYPFYLIGHLGFRAESNGTLSTTDFNALEWGVRALIVLVGILFLLLARLCSAIRVKNSALHIAGKNMKLLAEQLLKRKAAMESLSQRYPMDIPGNPDTVILPGATLHNDTIL